MLVGLLLVGFSPSLYHYFFAPRAAVLLVAIGPGLVLLARRLRTDRASQFAVLFLAVAAASTVLSPAPARALVGAPNSGTGLLFLAAGVATWALGSAMSPLGRTRARGVFLGGVMVNVAVAVMQSTTPIPITALALVDRPSGLTGNAVHLGALCAAAVPLVAKSRSRLGPASLVLLLLLGLGAQVSGGRSALAFLVIAAVGVAWRRPRTQALVVLVVLVAGVALGGLLPGSSTPSATQRVAAGAGGGSPLPRLHTWASVLPAIAERPLLGFGPGRFGEAASPRRTATIARLEGSDRLFRDAHNLVVEHATTTGVAGLATLLAWLALASRRARGSWAWCAAILAMAQLVEPMSVVATPLALLALGAGAPRPPPPARQPVMAAGAGLALAGLVAAGALLVGEHQLQEGSLDFSVPALDRADQLLPKAWPTVPLVAVRVHGFYGASDPTSRLHAVRHAREAVERDPYDPATWLRRANLEAVWGSEEQARVAFERALRLDPWSGAAMLGLARMANETGNGDEVALLCRRAGKVLTRGRCAGRPVSTW